MELNKWLMSQLSWSTVCNTKSFGGAVHPWIGGNQKVPLDILIYRLVRSYLRSSSMKRAALKVDIYILLSFGLCEVLCNLYSSSSLKNVLLLFGMYSLREFSKSSLLMFLALPDWIWLRKSLNISGDICRLYQKPWQRMNWCIYVHNSCSWSQTRMGVLHLKILKQWELWTFSIFFSFSSWELAHATMLAESKFCLCYLVVLANG
jgi:hypothetical protein